MNNKGVLEVAVNNLREKEHTFHFEVDHDFFEAYGSDIIQHGKLSVDVIIDKSSTMLQVKFKINGMIGLICDRSLDPFDYPISIYEKMIYKYGEKMEELSDEIMLIPHGEEVLDFGPPVNDFIVLKIPMKKLHPRYQDEEDDLSDGPVKMVYSVGTAPEDEEEKTLDPRWSALNKLKEQNKNP